MLGHWYKRLNDQVSDVPSNIFHNFLQNSLQKSFQFIFKFCITKIEIKSFECPKSIRNWKKNNAWNIRHLVDDSFVPSSKPPSIMYCRLTDFCWLSISGCFSTSCHYPAMVLNKLGVNQFTTLNYSKEMTGKWKNTVISNNNEWPRFGMGCGNSRVMEF